MDAGGLAQMTYNSNTGFNPTGTLGVPGAGFASRGKASQLKRLSVASPPKVASISEDADAPVPTPRTSRSHLLAGLRTQPKTPAVPSSAPFNQINHDFPMNASRRGNQQPFDFEHAMPHTAIGSGFPISPNSFINAGQQFYSTPEQVLAPPTVQFDGPDGEQWDPQVAAHLMATEMYLQQRQQQLQQQLLSLGLSGQQVQNMGFNMASPRNVPLPQTPMTPMSGGSHYQQQVQAGSAPMVQEVPGQPGLYQVYNPMTGQLTYAMDDGQQDGRSDSPQQPTSAHIASPPPSSRGIGNRNGYIQSPLSQSAHSFSPIGRANQSPPKKSPSPPSFEVTPLPPPSANAFRRGGSNGHKKSNSFALNTSSEGLTTPDRNGPRSALTPRVGLPQTPMTGTFGPGQNRAGEHPVRQPKGPPAIEELIASPTTKHEGSKNFARRQRSKALFTLRKAGIDRSAQPSSEGGSGPSTPSSEPELNFESDHSDTASYRSGSLSGKPSMSSLKAVPIGAIGSERKMRREGSQESVSSIGSFSDKGEEKKTGGRKSLAALMEAEKKRTGLF